MDIITRENFSLSVSPAAEQAKEIALTKAAAIGRVSNPAEQDRAVEAMRDLKTLAAEAERNRKDVKAPVLDFGTKIDAMSKAFVSEINIELIRLGTLAGNYQEEERAKARRAEAERMMEIQRLEEEKRKELAAAATPEAVQVIEERKAQEVEAIKPSYVAPRAEAQVVKEEWDFEIFDIHLLYREHPGFVRMEANTSEIKRALAMGRTEIKGLRCWKKTSVNVRARRTVEITQ